MICPKLSGGHPGQVRLPEKILLKGENKRGLQGKRRKGKGEQERRGRKEWRQEWQGEAKRGKWSAGEGSREEDPDPVPLEAQ